MIPAVILFGSVTFENNDFFQFKLKLESYIETFPFEYRTKKFKLFALLTETMFEECVEKVKGWAKS